MVIVLKDAKWEHLQVKQKWSENRPLGRHKLRACILNYGSQLKQNNPWPPTMISAFFKLLQENQPSFPVYVKVYWN